MAASIRELEDWDEGFLNEPIRIECAKPPPPHLGANASPFPAVASGFSPPRELSPQRPTTLLPTLPVDVAPFGAGFSPPRELSPQRPSPRLPTLPVDVAPFDAGFSPPRELSQRPADPPCVWQPQMVEDLVSRRSDRIAAAPAAAITGGVRGVKKDGEVERLKRELSHVSNQLTHLENECKKLKKDRSLKEEQLKNAFQEIEAKDIVIQNLWKSSMYKEAKLKAKQAVREAELLVAEGIPLPDEKEIEKMVVEQKKRELLSKYTSDILMEEQEKAKEMLNLRD